MVAKTNRYSHGLADLDDQAMNISGGTSPNIVSERRKNEKTILGGYVSTK
jgi:hypothetical protein